MKRTPRYQLLQMVFQVPALKILGLDNGATLWAIRSISGIQIVTILADKMF